MSKQVKADILLLLITAIWGISFPLMRNVIDNIPMSTYLLMRFLIASIVLIIVFYKKLKQITLESIIYSLVLGIMLFGTLFFTVKALYYTTASNVAFITGLSIVIVPIISAIYLKKKPDSFAIVGVVLSLSGLYFLSGGVNYQFNIGDLFTLIGAFCASMQIIFIDKFTNKNDPILLGVLQISWGSILYFLLCVGTGLEVVILNPSIIITVFVTGILGTALAFTAQTAIQKFTSPVHTVLIFTLEPVFGVLFSILIPKTNGQKELITMNIAIGCILILGGMLLSEMKRILGTLK